MLRPVMFKCGKVTFRIACQQRLVPFSGETFGYEPLLQIEKMNDEAERINS